MRSTGTNPAAATSARSTRPRTARRSATTSASRTSARFERYEMPDADEHVSFLEMLDVVNQRLIEAGKDPIAFEHDCREGICGSCGMVINGRPHGPVQRVTACQLPLRGFKGGDTLW